MDKLEFISRYLKKEKKTILNFLEDNKITNEEMFYFCKNSNYKDSINFIIESYDYNIDFEKSIKKIFNEKYFNSTFYAKKNYDFFSKSLYNNRNLYGIDIIVKKFLNYSYYFLSYIDCNHNELYDYLISFDKNFNDIINNKIKREKMLMFLFNIKYIYSNEFNAILVDTIKEKENSLFFNNEIIDDVFDMKDKLIDFFYSKLFFEIAEKKFYKFNDFSFFNIVLPLDPFNFSSNEERKKYEIFSNRMLDGASQAEFLNTFFDLFLKESFKENFEYDFLEFSNEVDLNSNIQKTKLKKGNFIENFNDFSLLKKFLNDNIKGQNEVIDNIIYELEYSKLKLMKTNGPISVFFLAGPTGVGKTEIVKLISKFLKVDLIRSDMNEYIDRTSLNKFYGAAAGYIGYDNKTSPLHKASEKNEFIFLFDEIEKANPVIFSSLLTILDEGYATAADNTFVDFSNSIIFFTSNIGVKEVSDFKIGFNSNNNFNKKKEYINQIKKKLIPEFYGRINNVLIFNNIDYNNFKEITISIFKEIENNFCIEYDKDIKFIFEDSFFNFISSKSNFEKYGVRNIKNVIKGYLIEIFKFINKNYSLENENIYVLKSVSNSFVIEKKIRKIKVLK